VQQLAAQHQQMVEDIATMQAAQQTSFARSQVLQRRRGKPLLLLRTTRCRAEARDSNKPRREHLNLGFATVQHFQRRCEERVSG